MWRGSHEVTKVEEDKMLSGSFGYRLRGCVSGARNIPTEHPHSLPSGKRKTDYVDPLGPGRHELPRKPKTCEDIHKRPGLCRNIKPSSRDYDVLGDILGILVRSIPDHASSPLK
ncbi:hypothetical protein GCM10009715_06180 [Paeniglutamicibacter psychrophenolicus]